MKRILLLSKLIAFLLTLGLKCTAQESIYHSALPVDTVTHEVVYEGINTAPGSKPELASRALWWWAQNHIDDNEYVHYQDITGGHLVAHGYIPLKEIAPLARNTNGYNIWYTLYFSAKDGKYKYTFMHFSVYGYGNYGSDTYHPLGYILEFDHPNWYKDVFKNLDTKMKEIISSMQMAMAKDEDW